MEKNFPKAVQAERVTRKIIALPTIQDLRAEAERTGKTLSRAQEMQYTVAQHRIRQAHRRMAKAALSVVRPDDFRDIEMRRKDEVRRANEAALDKMCAFFSDDCTSGL